ncbi:MAG TPA: peptide chain release factor N(5)-glutamine methyltransferase [Stellaceae bacterium]|nr:peptide chain release factor N(5)-glutamine methyltransferase [Stellaceae bacterium]
MGIIVIPPQTIASTLSSVAAALAEAGFDEPRRQARRLLAAALGLSPAEMLATDGRRLTKDEERKVNAVLDSVLAREPLSRILGVRAFWGLDFVLSKDTLDPRPETETVIEAILARLPERKRGYRILDLGTGTGCLLLALLSEFPAATGIGVDRAAGAAATARDNAVRLGLADRAHFVVGDWAAAISGSFDAVVANPPYIPQDEIAGLPREVRDHDPRLALDGGADGLAAYRAIAADLPHLLRRDGVFACEIGAGQESAAAAIFADAGLVIDAVLPDLAGIPRCVVARCGSSSWAT